MATAFKQTHIGTDEPIKIKAGQKGVPIFWEFEDLKPEDIATYEDSSGKTKYAVAPHCGCTAKVTVKEDGIHAEYNDSGNKFGTLKKAMTVYFAPKDDRPVRVKTPKGESFNQNLGKVVLSFMVDVSK